MIYELASPNGQRLLRSGVPVEVAIQHGEKRKNIKYGLLFQKKSEN